MTKIRVGGNPKGEAVRTLSPENGPLSREESTLLRNAIRRDDDDANAESVRRRCVAMLSHLFGVRSTTISHLREVDLRANIVVGEQAVDYALDLPMAKKGMPPRSEFHRLGIRTELARLLLRQIALNRVAYPIPAHAEERPLIFAKSPKLVHGNIGYQCSSKEIAGILMSVALRSGVISPRTGQPLKLNPQRLRYTVGTDMGREGFGAREIAAVLGHADLQQVHVYVEASKGIIEHLDRALADQYAPFMTAFGGKQPVMSSESRCRLKVSYIADDGSVHVLGGCYQINSPCRLHPPYSCYHECDLFEPFIDAGHEVFLNDLLTHRDTLRTDEIPSHRRVAPLRDHVIFSVALVNQLVNGIHGPSAN